MAGRNSNVFSTREAAGRALADALSAMEFRDPVILALPRGGVPVAVPVAEALSAPIDLLMVRKLGLPDQPEVAAGAVVEGPPPETVFNNHILAAARMTTEDFDQMVEDKLAQIAERRHHYLAGRPPLPVAGRDVIVVDDGIATGATMRAGLQGLRARHPASITVAVPVAPRGTLEKMRALAEHVVCLEVPEPFWAVGAHFQDFTQVNDEEVVALLAAHDTFLRNKEAP